jgi:hypothetical protein
VLGCPLRWAGVHTRADTQQVAGLQGLNPVFEELVVAHQDLPSLAYSGDILLAFGDGSRALALDLPAGVANTVAPAVADQAAAARRGAEKGRTYSRQEAKSYLPFPERVRQPRQARRRRPQKEDGRLAKLAMWRHRRAECWVVPWQFPDE